MRELLTWHVVVLGVHAGVKGHAGGHDGLGGHHVGHATAGLLHLGPGGRVQLAAHHQACHALEVPAHVDTRLYKHLSAKCASVGGGM